MHEREKREFAGLMHATAAYYDRKLLPAVMETYWAGLADLSLEAVRAALNAHAQDPQAGQFMPKIADIRRQIELRRDDGHPGPDEAWSIALPARDESASVVWTPLIRLAFLQVAVPLLDEGDKIAARKAFLERYEQDLAAARRRGEVAVWEPSIGTDSQGREPAVQRAIEAGRLRADHAQALLPAPSIDVRPLLAAPAPTCNPEVVAAAKAALRRFIGRKSAA